MANELISVAMTTYNGEKFLRQQLDSIFAQTYTCLEVVVTDDQSTDGTVSILHEYSKKYPLHYAVNEGTLGVVKNFERAVSLCGGTYVAFADQDDVWLPDKLALCLQKMQSIEASHPDTPVLVHTDLRVVDEQLNTVRESLWRAHGTDPVVYKVPEQVAARNFVTGCTMLLNRQALGMTMPFPAEVLMHDWWIAINIIKHGIITSIPEATVLYRQHGGNQVGFKRAGVFSKVTRLFDFRRYVRSYVTTRRMLRRLDFKVRAFKLLYYKIVFYFEKR